MKAIAFNGSPNKKGRTVEYLEQVGLPIVHLADGIANARAEVLSADLVLFATPVYWYNVSALMKELIEALPEAPSYECEGKVAFLLAVCDDDGGQQALNQMMAPLSHMGFSFPPYAAANYINTNLMQQSEHRWQCEVTRYLKKQIARFKRSAR
jgi:multimeric flavodoxin WrbA